MTINFLAKKRATLDCDHETQMRIEVAGMSRGVCETCGRVSVGFVGEHFGSEWAQVLMEAAASPEPEAGEPGELD